MTTATFADSLAGHRDYLIRQASARLRDGALAEDVVQDTLLAAIETGHRFEQRATLRTWLTGILLRRIADTLRRNARRPTVAIDDADGDGHDADADAAGTPRDEPVDWIDPPRRLESRQRLAAIAASLDALPPTAARLLRLRALDGLDAPEAAARLGLSARGSALLLHRTRRTLRAALAAA